MLQYVLYLCRYFSDLPVTNIQQLLDDILIVAVSNLIYVLFGSLPSTVHSVIMSKNSMVYFQLNQKKG